MDDVEGDFTLQLEEHEAIQLSQKIHHMGRMVLDRVFLFSNRAIV